MIKVTFVINANTGDFGGNESVVSQRVDLELNKNATAAEYIAASLILFLATNTTEPGMIKTLEDNVGEVHGVVGMLISKQIKEQLGKEDFGMIDLMLLLENGDIPVDVADLLTNLAKSDARGNPDGLLWGQKQVSEEEAHKRMSEQIDKDLNNLINDQDKKPSIKTLSKEDNDFNKDII